MLGLPIGLLGVAWPTMRADFALPLGAMGLLLISTRTHYYEQTEFQQQVDALLEQGQLKQLQVIWDAPYNHDGDAHYWVFRKAG